MDVALKKYAKLQADVFGYALYKNERGHAMYKNERDRTLNRWWLDMEIELKCDAYKGYDSAAVWKYWKKHHSTGVCLELSLGACERHNCNGGVFGHKLTDSE